MLLLSVFKVLLHRYSGQEDIVVSSPIANRTQVEVEPLIGFFVNTLVLRSDLGGNPRFTDLLGQVRQMTLKAYEHQDVPYERIVDRVVKQRDVSVSPLDQVVFLMRNNPDQVDEIELEEVVLENVNAENNYTTADLHLSVKEAPDGLRIVLNYNTDLYEEKRMKVLLSHYVSLLDSVSKHPELELAELAMLGKHETERILQSFNDTITEFGAGQSVLDLYAEQLQKCPDAPAVSGPSQQLSYRELDAASTKLAAYLRTTYDVGANDLVGMMMPVDEWSIISILGILKSGAAYVPIDMNYPEERKKYMIEQSEMKALLIHSDSLLTTVDYGVPLFAVDLQLDTVEALPITESAVVGSDLVYVIYTSGSTGRPKGVMISHDNLFNYLSWAGQYYGRETESFDFGYFTSPGFDLTQTSIFLPLISGGCIHIEAEGTAVEQLTKLLENPAVNALKLTPSHVELIGEGTQSGVKNFIVGGEELQMGQLKKLQRLGLEVSIYNEYGPTETTIGCTVSDVSQLEEGSVITIGQPVGNARIYILDQQGGVVPVGAVGEIYIGGRGVGQGYLKAEALTAERFLADPFREGGRMYRSGDRGRWLPDGQIEYLGRCDDVVKIRGYRVGLGEVENRVQSYAGVERAAVLAVADHKGNKRLAAYVVGAEGYARESLRTYLKEQLPGYMVPTVYMEVAQLHLTVHGKIDKSRLPAIDWQALGSADYQEARNEGERRLVKVWQEVLGLERVGVQDNFFDLGGHSLLAIQLVAAIRQELGYEPDIRTIFEYPTIAQLWAQLSSGPQEESSTRTLEVQDRPSRIPLSYAQERLWFIDRFEGSTHYHVSRALSIKGKLDVEALELALRTIVNRHEALRTVFLEKEGIPYQEMLPLDLWQLKHHTDLVSWTTEAVNEAVADFIKLPFDLSNDHMFRAKLIERADNHFVLVFVFHHIASDAHSILNFLRELAELYRSRTENRPDFLPELPVQYPDYAIWQRQNPDEAEFAAKFGYWKNKLKGVEPLQLPTDYSYPAVQSFAGNTANFKIDERLTMLIKTFSKEEGVTPFILLLTVFKVLLSKYCNQRSIAVGTPTSDRTHLELNPLIGFFINTLVLQSEIRGEETFRENLTRVKETVLEAHQNREIPFEHLVNQLWSSRDQSRSPLFQVLFAFQNDLQPGELSFGEDLKFDSIDKEQRHSKFELTFNVRETPENFIVNIDYRTALFAEPTISRLFNHYRELIRHITQDADQQVSDLSMMKPAELYEVLYDFNDTACYYPKEETLVSLFEEKATQFAGEVAVTYQGKTLSYLEVNEKANGLAHHLLDNFELTAEDNIGIMMEPSEWAIIAILAILKTGCAYVPIDPGYPDQRKTFMMEDADLKLIIADFIDELSLNLPVVGADFPGQEVLEKPPVIEPKNLAYIIYTSGSTGRPKGCLVEHQNVVNEVTTQMEYFGIREDDRILLASNIVFDASVEQLFMALLGGASIHLVDKQTLLDPALLSDYLAKNEITHLHMVPSLLATVPVKDYGNLRRVIAGGEACSRALAERWSDRYNFYNEYGPTESTITSTQLKFNPEHAGDKLTIGRPIANTSIYILDEYMKPVPYGVYGEIYIGGAGVCRGYLNRESLTREKFVANPFAEGGRMYKTGDIGRWLSNAQIEFSGRADDQVKLRGYRIELEEIRTLLLEHPVVSQALVLIAGSGVTDQRIVAYTVAEEEVTERELLAYLRQALPSYMMPSEIIQLEDFPHLANGKVDREALLQTRSTRTDAERVAPRDQLEQQLAEIWKNLLKIPEVGIHDNFFEIGGHSLIATQVISAIQSVFEITVPVRIIFEYTCIADLAKYIKLVKAKKVFTDAEDLVVIEI